MQSPPLLPVNENMPICLVMKLQSRFGTRLSSSLRSAVRMALMRLAIPASSTCHNRCTVGKVMSGIVIGKAAPVL